MSEEIEEPLNDVSQAFKFDRVILRNCVIRADGGNCPQCESRTGIKMIHNGDIYCEDCGWPNEYFGE